MSHGVNASWRSLALGETLARNARKFQSKVALVSGDVRSSFAQLNERVNRLASALSLHAVSRGTKVAVMAYNSHQTVETYFAAIKLGAVVVPINYRMTLDEVRFILTHSGSQLLFFAEQFIPLVRELARSGVERWAAQMGGDDPSFAYSYQQLIEEGSPREPDVVLDDDDDAFIMYTSGTTGFPKGAVLTHKNLWVNTANWIMEIGVNTDSVWLSGLPLCHIGGLNGLLPFIFIGGTVVFAVSASFDPVQAVRTMVQERVTHCNFVPTMWQQILEVDLRERDLSALRTALWGASTAPLSLLEQMSRELPGVEIVNAYGQTEMSSNRSFLRGKDAIRKMGSVGRSLVNVEYRIVDDADGDVAPGEVGEIVYRGPTVLKEYYKDPEATAEAMRGGWFHSGDLVREDGEGYLYLVDRKKDVIISGGENIYPAEVERIISQHPAVRDVAVIGVPDSKWIETPKALIVLRDGFHLRGDEVIDHCKQHLASYKKPKYVAFLEELPRNAAGKVLRRELRRLHGNASDG